MAKLSFSPALWFLLALVLRADGTASGQSGYPTSTKAAAVRSNTARTQSTINRSAVEYEVSGEAYQEDSPRPSTSTSQRQGRKTKPRNQAAPRLTSVEYGDPVYEEDEERTQAKPSRQVAYQPETFVAEDEVDPYSAGPEFADEYTEGEEEYWAEEEAAEEARHGGWLWGLHGEHEPWLRTSKNSPRDIGLGEPLKGTSWLNRPNSVSFFTGVLNGDEMIKDRVGQGSALFGGVRVGWDFDHYWGMELRSGWSSPDVEYDPPPPPDRVDGIWLLDASFLYYPWGDSAWRPYTLLGMGMARFDFTDEIGLVHDEYLLGIPIGLGMKYQYHPNLVFRAEFLDNIACGSSGLSTMNNLSFTLGMEVRFGGKPRSYYPWQPAKYIW